MGLRFSTKYRFLGHLLVEQLESRCVLATEGELITIERSLDTSGLSGNISGTISWNDGTSRPAQVINQPSAGPLRIRFDYSLDTSGFFAAQSRRDLLQLAADTLITKFSDNLAAIAPGGVNQWNANFQHPATGQMTSVANLNIAANELLIYVGARALSGSTLALASIGGYSASGTQTFLDTVKARGQTGALAASPTDFGPWGGAITFQSTANWHFSTSTTGLESTESDFLSSAIHELCHILGFGTAPSWATQLNSTQFIGANAKAKYDLGGNIPTDSIRVHWVDGTLDGGQETLMDPTLGKGVRKSLTRLDLAGLQDIGWTLIEPTATIRGSHTFADNGNFDVNVQLVGARSGTGGWSQTLSVSNAIPTLAPINNQVVLAGSPLVLSRLGVFSDLGFDNPLDSPPTQERFTYQIEWGDGSAAENGNATIESMGKEGTATTGFFGGSHVYTSAGNYNVQVRINDDDGGSATRSFTVNVQAAPQLTLNLTKSVVNENAGMKAAVLTVRKSGGATSAITVNLNSSDTSELRLPQTATIPAGASEVLIDLEAVDDQILDGNVVVTITASAAGFGNGSAQLQVNDVETITGVISQTSINENAGPSTLTWTLSRSNTDQSLPLIVQLVSSDTTELSVPATATIAAGTASITVPVTVHDDSILDGAIAVTLSANAVGYQSGISLVSVLDVESLQLSINEPQLREKTPTAPTRATLTLSFPAPTGGYVVQLAPTKSNQLSVPQSVTVPQGSQNIEFDVSAIDDYAVEGLMALQLVASANGLSPSSVDLVIEDNDQPLWQNPLDKWDCDNNTVFNAMDALVIINNLNRFGSRFLRPGVDVASPPYVDSNGDGIVNAIDALMVINELNRRFAV